MLNLTRPGVTLISIGLPLLCYVFAFVCNDVSGCPAPSLRSPVELFTAPLGSRMPGWWHGREILKKEVGWPGWTGLLNVEAVAGTAFWYALSLALWAVLPAHEVAGVELVSGGKMKYRLNGRIEVLDTLERAADLSLQRFSPLRSSLPPVLLGPGS